MARVISEADLPNGRVFSLWEEAGMKHRSNVLLRVGSSIPLHRHRWPHVAHITRGLVSFRATAPDGTVTEGLAASSEYTQAHPFTVCGSSRVTIPAEYQHTFTLLDGAPGEVLCIWPG